MLFKLTNILVTYQRQNNKILKEFSLFVIYYLDNILIFSERAEDYEDHIKQVIRALSQVDSRLKLSKYKFGVKEVTFLRYIIRLGQMSIDLKKI